MKHIILFFFPFDVCMIMKHNIVLSPPSHALQEYPEYYQVIKKPIDMQKIQQRMQLKQYENLDEMVNDFLLMFDNACKFNEPDSLIYKVCVILIIAHMLKIINAVGPAIFAEIT